MDWTPTRAELIDWASHLLRGLQILNAPDSPDRNRETSLAITNLEQAIHWLEAVEEDN